MPSSLRTIQRRWLAGTSHCLHLGLALFVLLFSVPAAPQTQAPPRQEPAPLTIPAQEPPRAVLRSAYHFELKAQGGTEPRKWKLEEGELPPGMELSPAGVLTGAPAALGNFRFQASVADSAPKPQRVARWFVLRVVAPLVIIWKAPPQLESDRIFGAVEVTNATDDDFDLTVIIVAVNEINKAFALGYQHFTLRRQTESLVIDFGSTLPRGAYIVHADAVAEIAPKNVIHRSRMQTMEALKVP